MLLVLEGKKVQGFADVDISFYVKRRTLNLLMLKRFGISVNFVTSSSLEKRDIL